MTVRFDSDALRVTAISSESAPNSFANPSRTLSIRGSRIRAMCSTGSSLEKRMSRIICSSAIAGAGLDQPLLRLTSVSSRVNARRISAQYNSSSAIESGELEPAISVARLKWRNADELSIGAAMPAANMCWTNARRSVMTPSSGSELRIRGHLLESYVDRSAGVDREAGDGAGGVPGETNRSDRTGREVVAIGWAHLIGIRRALEQHQFTVLDRDGELVIQLVAEVGADVAGQHGRRSVGRGHFLIYGSVLSPD